MIAGAGFATWAWREAQRLTLWGTRPGVVPWPRGRGWPTSAHNAYYEILDAATAAFNARKCELTHLAVTRKGGSTAAHPTPSIYTTRGFP